MTEISQIAMPHGKKIEDDKDNYFPPCEHQHLKETKGVHIEYISYVLSKFQGLEKSLKLMKKDVITLKKTIISHFVSIKQLETQLGKIS